MDKDEESGIAPTLDIQAVESHTGNRAAHTVDAVNLAAYSFTQEENDRLVRKLDLHILPLIWGCYLFNSLDRGNVSNAKSDGMTTDLHFPYNGYGIMLSVFYITFSTMAIPGVLLTRKIGAKWTVPGYMAGWGLMATVNAGCRNFGGVVAVRLILGAFEAGFIPSLMLLLTSFYTRGELAKRVAVFYSCNAISGAFSGLLAYGVFQVKSRLWGWQILFLIEGTITIAFAALVFWLLPFAPSSASFLSDREKAVAMLRILKDGSSETETKLNHRAFLAPLRDWKYYVFTIISLFYGVATSVASNFLTQIIGRFNYSVVKTNLFTVAPYTAAAIFLFALSWSSDHFRERGFHLALCFVLVLVGCIILVCIPVSSKGVGYFATFLITMGSLTPSVIFHPWYQNNDASEDGRAFRVGSVVFIGNAAGIVSANIFLAKWEPQYRIPLAIVAGMEGVALILTVGLRMWMTMDNRRRNREQGVNWQSKDVPTEALADGPANPLFRHFC